MTSPTPVGVVTELWRFPVKSMQGERLLEAQVAAQGIVGDRSTALLDADAGVIATASRLPGLLDCQACFVTPPTPGEGLPPVRITLPGGAAATTDSPELPGLLAAHFGRALTIARTPPTSYSTAQAAFFAKVGLALAPTSTMVDFCPLSLITSSTLASLGLRQPDARFDLKRFRMNVRVDTGLSGFPENEWVNRRLRLGPSVDIAVPMADPRCAMTTLPQGDLPRDPAILRTIAAANSQPVGTGGPLPCAGVYADVLAGGTIRLGDPVYLL